MYIGSPQIQHFGPIWSLKLLILVVRYHGDRWYNRLVPWATWPQLRVYYIATLACRTEAKPLENTTFWTCCMLMVAITILCNNALLVRTRLGNTWCKGLKGMLFRHLQEVSKWFRHLDSNLIGTTVVQWLVFSILLLCKVNAILH